MMTVERAPLQIPWYRPFAGSQDGIPKEEPAEAFQRDEEKTLLVTERIDLGGGTVLLPGMRLHPGEVVLFLVQRPAPGPGVSGS
ncbi:MAG: hypothetical protein AB1714_07010 [Acidobacteriota bacterium]